MSWTTLLILRSSDPSDTTRTDNTLEQTEKFTAVLALFYNI